jgi:hypothetical protein
MSSILQPMVTGQIKANFLMKFTKNKEEQEVEVKLYQDNGHHIDTLCFLNQEITTILKLRLDFTHKSSGLVEFQQKHNSQTSGHLMDQEVKILVHFKISGDLLKTFIQNP